MKIYLVTAEHFRDGGIIHAAFASHDDALAEAVRLTSAMVSDHGWNAGDVNTATFNDFIERLQDYHGAAHCYVEITVLNIAGSEFIDTALRIAGQIARSETDADGDLIVFADDMGSVAVYDAACAIEGEVDAYLARFPADHRATADRAYQDGFVDGVESAKAEG